MCWEMFNTITVLYKPLSKHVQSSSEVSKDLDSITKKGRTLFLVFPEIAWLLASILVALTNSLGVYCFFLPWMSSCASLFWNGSFGRRESLINLSAVTGEKTGIRPQANPKCIYIYIYINIYIYIYYIVVCFLLCPVFYLRKQNLRCGCTTNHEGCLEGCHTLKTVVNKWKVFRDVFGCVRFAWTMWMPWLLWLP